MFSAKYLLAALALLCVANPETEAKKTKLKYYVRGTNVGPDESFCYSGTYETKKGKTLGEYKDCVTTLPEVDNKGRIKFDVVTTFTPDKITKQTPGTFVTTCSVTVSEKDGLPDPFNAKEKCKNKKGILEGIQEVNTGRVKLNGKVDNTGSPLLTFDLQWIIQYSGDVATPTDDDTDTLPPAESPTDDGSLPPAESPTDDGSLPPAESPTDDESRAPVEKDDD